jgi:hypothetical protein
VGALPADGTFAKSRQGPEALALRTTRRWLILATASAVVTVAALLGLRSWSGLSLLEHLMLVGSIALVGLAVALRRNDRMLWLAPAGVLCLSLPALLEPTGSPAWIPMPNAVANAGYISILLLPRWIGLAVVVGNGALLATVISRDPTNVVGAALDVAGGRVVVLQIVVASLALWWAWQLQAHQAQAAGADLALREAATARALAQQERARVWRATATRLHESVLNSIRYVLSTGTVDRARLAEALSPEVTTPGPPEAADDRTVITLVSRLHRDESVGAVLQVVGALPQAELTTEVFEGARAALVELARNAVRHGGATRILIQARIDGPAVVLTLTDNGTGLTAGAPLGIGLGTVLDASLSDTGGSWSLQAGPGGGVSAVVSVPRLLPPRRSSAPYTPFDKGRFLVTALLAGSAAVGIAYYVLWAVDGGVRGLPILAAGLVSISCAVWLVLRRRRVGALPGLVMLAGAAAVPWLLVGQPLTCEAVPDVAPVVNIAGFAVLIIAAWSRVVTGVIGLSTWIAGSVVVIAALPPGCGSTLALALLNGIAIIPVLLGVTYAGVRGFERAQERERSARLLEIQERSRAEAELELNRTLHTAVGDAMDLLGRIAEGAAVDAAMRTDLELCDMRIRAAIQVDPRSAGGLSAAARQLAERAAAAGVRLDVRSLTSSPDGRPLPPDVIDLVARVLAVPVSPVAVIQSFTTGVDDHLAIATAPAALEAAGLVDGTALDVGGVTVEVDIDTEGTDARGTVLVSRPVADQEQPGDQ